MVGIKASDGQSMRFVYDKYNRLSLSKWALGDISLSNGYIYGDSSVAGQKNGLIYGVNLNGAQKLGYAYDELSRLQSRTVGTETPFVTEYTYLEGKDSNTTTTLVKTVKNGSDTLEYTYDALGNITTVSKNGIVIEQYSYDELNQLKSAVYGEDTYQYFYDDGGNLTEIKKNNEVIKSYSYGNSEWKDLLTSFNGEAITYDAIGNPLSYRNGMSFTWQNGRQLAGISKNGTTLASYTYNAEGLRTSKTVNGVTTDYYWLNGVLQGQKTGEESILFLYDENGNAYGFITKNGTGESTYYYEFNVQGDIIGIIDSTGTKVVEYTYGAWGDILSVTGTLADTIGQMNPLRYREYYYDAETGRFINADSQLNPSAGMTGYNLLCYGGNNPVNTVDSTGHAFMFLTAAIGVIVGGVAGGIIAAKTGKNVWAGIGIGAVAGGLIGLGAGAAAGVLLAGSATASTAAVISGAGMFVTAVSTGGLGTGVALITDNVFRAVNNSGTVLYSGGAQAAKKASEFAGQTGGTIIDNTKIGEIASIATQRAYADFTTVWSQASATFCNQASGTVNAFISNSAYRGVDSIFWSVEMPTLLNNPRVTEIIIHIFE